MGVFFSGMGTRVKVKELKDREAQTNEDDTI